MSDGSEELGSHDLALLLQLHDACDICTDHQQLGTLIDHRGLHLNVAFRTLRLEDCLKLCKGFIIMNAYDVVPQVLALLFNV